MPDTIPTKELEFPQTLEQGSSGRDVRRIQEWLCLNGFGVVVDGDFGPATEDGVKAFRRKRRLPVRGPVDAATFDKLSSPMRRALSTPRSVPRDIGDAVVYVARRHLTQHPREIAGQNLGPWVRLYMDGKEGKSYPWCVGFVQLVIRQACDALNVEKPFVHTYSCDRLASDGCKKGLFIRQAEIGASNAADLPPPGTVFLQRREPGDWTHAGVVVRANKETFETIEGNTNDEGSREGYEVCYRVRGYHNKDFVMLPRPPSPAHRVEATDGGA